MEITIEQVKEFAWQQLDAMWHDNSGTATINMVITKVIVSSIHGWTKRRRKP